MCGLLLTVVVTGCGGGKGSFTPTDPTPTVSVIASPTSIAPGSSSTLTVTATNASGVTVTGSDGTSYKLSATGGTQAVSPTATITYTAKASGAGGDASATATVTVTTAPPPAPTVTLTASPSSILSGGSSTLTVAATNATQVTLTGSDGSSNALSASGGTQAVSPTATTTYTAKASGAGGDVIATATITVAANPVPSITIAASPTSIAAGNSSTLTITALNATQINVAGSDGTTYTLPLVGGTQVVSPAVTATYTATALGAGGKATATATVTVTPNPAPTVTIVANPAAISSGSSSILTITAINATKVTLTGSDKTTYQMASSGGTQAVSPTATTVYTVTASGPGGNASAFATLTVTPNPAPTVTILASPGSIQSGGTSTLSVTADNATQVTIAGSDGTSYTLQSSGGTQDVTPAATTTYTVTATGPGGKVTAATTVTVTPIPTPTVTISASPASVISGNSSTLTVAATNATQVTITGTDSTSYNLQPSGGTQQVTPSSTTTYSATATGAGGNATASTTVTVTIPGSLQSIDHVIFLLQENHSFDNYFGMLNPYKVANHMNVGDDGATYLVDGIDDKLTTISNMNDEGTVFAPFKFSSTCIDDESSDWLSSYGDVDRYNFLNTRPIKMDGFVHTAEGFAKSCASGVSSCSGEFTDTIGQRSMGYYDGDFLNYYYYMASQFALSDRWFSPIASKSVPNRIATFTGGTTRGLIKDPGGNDHLPQLDIQNIFQELDQAKVSWKIYFTVTEGLCFTALDCINQGKSVYPAIHFSNLTYSYQYVYVPKSGAACTPPTQPSSVDGDPSNSYCVDLVHIAPISSYFDDLKNGTLPSFAFIESGSGHNDEHPGSEQSILNGQSQMASIINQLMASSSWKDSVFFLSYDEGGGPYDHVPPVPGHSNHNTFASLGTIPDISTIAVNPDSYGPCVPPGGGAATLHCDLKSTEPGANPNDAAAISGFSAQLGFRVPNMVISPFTRRHYVSHIPMDHTAVIKFVENRFIGSSAHLTPHDAAQPNLLDFFDFTNIPWATPPANIPAPVTPASLGYDPCKPANFTP
jgi:phospholipase C